MKYSTNNRGRCSPKTPIRRAGAALQMVRSFWINTRIFHLNGYCDSQQISNVRSSPRRSLKGYWPFFCMKGNKRGMAWKSELYTQRNSCFYNIIVKAICQFSDPQWTRWMRTTTGRRPWSRRTIMNRPAWVRGVSMGEPGFS